MNVRNQLLRIICASTKADFEKKRSVLKATETKLRHVNSLIHTTGQYLSTKSVHAEYLKAKNKKQFREEHSSELAIYDAALKELKACYGDQKFQTMKQLKERKNDLTAAKNEQYEDFCFARSRHREIQTVHANVRTMLDRQPDRNQSQEKHRN